jgi:hypothetical protein
MRSFTLTNGVTLSLIALALLAVPQARADTYTDGTLNFSVSFGGPAPTSGSFVYDDTMNALISYTVVWDGTTFPDFPSFFPGDTLSQLTASGHWCAMATSATTVAPGNPLGCAVEPSYFEIGDAIDSFIPGTYTDATSSADGTFTVSTTTVTSSVPEPSTLALLSTALAGLAFGKFRTNRRGRRLRPRQPEAA